VNRLQIACRKRAAGDATGYVLTAEEPTDWGGGSGFYDAFVEVAPNHIRRPEAAQHLRLPLS
jgi:hypothetical protein